MKVLFVCLGNICRSPAAEGLFRHRIHQLGKEEKYFAGSAGTSAYHIGEPPDSRMVQAAKGIGVGLSGIARQFVPQDFKDFDLILAMDPHNYSDILRLNPQKSEEMKVKYFRSFDPLASGEMTVPDPYFGGDQGFAETLKIIERTVENLVESMENQK